MRPRSSCNTESVPSANNPTANNPKANNDITRQFRSCTISVFGKLSQSMSFFFPGKLVHASKHVSHKPAIYCHKVLLSLHLPLTHCSCKPKACDRSHTSMTKYRHKRGRLLRMHITLQPLLGEHSMQLPVSLNVPSALMMPLSQHAAQECC